MFLEYIQIRKWESMKKYFKLIIFLSLFLLTIAYTYYLRPLVDDELYNYGFSISILNGLIPYKDFNMIIPPLFSYLLSFVLLIFGKKLIVYHSLIAIMITIMTVISYKKIGKLSIIIYILLLVYPYTGYNMFCLFLFFILLNLKETKYLNILEPILISMMILSKHTLGLLIIPSFIYSKNRKKTFSIYLLSGLLLFLYLIFNDSLIPFIDYSILGMFDFSNKNTTGMNLLFVIEIFLILGLIYLTMKTKQKKYFYCLMFQIITFPIIDYVHFIISFIPIVYLALQKLFYQNKVFINGIFILILTATMSFFITLNFMELGNNNNYLFLEHYKVNNFMKGRVTYRITSEYISSIQKQIEAYPNYDLYILGNLSYIVKLNLYLPLNKYDNINNGNMGYYGVRKYLTEINNNCEKKQCLFIINEDEYRTQRNQTNHEILEYVIKNYQQKYSSNTFSIYIN